MDKRRINKSPDEDRTARKRSRKPDEQDPQARDGSQEMEGPVFYTGYEPPQNAAQNAEKVCRGARVLCVCVFDILSFCRWL
jgi:hypothetical protein